MVEMSLNINELLNKVPLTGENKFGLHPQYEF